jgi:hypothetical protein
LAWQEEERVQVQVGDGGFIPVYLHELDVPVRQYRFSGRIGFSDYLGIQFNLIGRIPLFDQFVICFDDRRGVVGLEPHPER